MRTRAMDARTSQLRAEARAKLEAADLDPIAVPASRVPPADPREPSNVIPFRPRRRR